MKRSRLEIKLSLMRQAQGFERVTVQPIGDKLYPVMQCPKCGWQFTILSPDQPLKCPNPQCRYFECRNDHPEKTGASV